MSLRYKSTVRGMVFTYILLLLLAQEAAAGPKIEWDFRAQSNLYAPPLVADLHPAAGLESVISDSEAKTLRCIDARGNQLWEYRAGWEKRLIASAALSSADSGEPRLLLIPNADGRLCCIDAATGTERWQKHPGVVEWGGALWADLDGDGIEEGVVGTESRGVVVLDRAGETVWRYRGEQVEAPLHISCPLSAVDIDGDGKAEVFGAGLWGPFCLASDGTLRWQQVMGAEFLCAPTVADANGDGQAEVYYTSRNENAAWAFDATTGTILWKTALFGETDVYPGSSIAVGDLDGDGAWEIVAGDADGNVCALSCGGTLRWTYATRMPVHVAPALGDVDGDGAVEVLLASGDHHLYCLDANGRLEWKFETGLRLIHPPTMADVDLDGKTDILFCGGDRTLRCLTLEGRHRPERLPWPSGRHDAQKTGAVFPRTPQGARVVVRRSLFSHGGFELDRTGASLTPYPEGSSVLEKCQATPRGWTLFLGEGNWALEKGVGIEGQRALRTQGAVRFATDPVRLEPYLSAVAISLHARGQGQPDVCVEWIGHGVIGRSRIEGTEALSDGWVRVHGEATPPSGACWLRLTVAVSEGAWCFDAAEIAGVFREAPTAEVLVNQVGYEIDAPKHFTVQSNWCAGTAEFVLLREDGTEAHHGVIEHRGRIQGHFGNDWGHEYWRGDFSAFDTPGRYRIRVRMDGQSFDSWPFCIGEKLLWQATSRPAYRFFYYQRCGGDVPGFHGPCHLDDAAGPDGASQHELWGGWHDAGDYNTYHNAPYVRGLLRAYGIHEEAFNQQDEDENGRSDFLDEILWGAEHSRRMIVQDGSAFGHISSGYGYWGPPELETDNIPGTGDERRIRGSETGHDPSHHHAAVARVARYATEPSPWVECARRSLEWALNHDKRGVAQFGTAVDLFLATGEKRYGELAKELFPAVAADAAVADAVYRFDAAFGEDHTEELRKVFMQKAEALLALADNPFGVYASSGPPDNPNFFGAPADTGGWHVGTSSHILEAANLAALAYQYEPNPAYLAFALNQFNWTLGNNPFNISLMEGQGSAFPPTYHHRYTFSGVPRGAVPGSVVNGITWRAAGDDRPFFDMSGVDIPAYEPNEAWLPHNTAYLNALANLYAAIAPKQHR